MRPSDKHLSSTFCGPGTNHQGCGSEQNRYSSCLYGVPSLTELDLYK